MIGGEVREGKFGEVSLAGVRYVIAFMYPKAIHEGGGSVVVFIDERATREQAEAIATILSGRAGGMPFEALAGTFRLGGRSDSRADRDDRGRHALVLLAFRASSN